MQKDILKKSIQGCCRKMRIHILYNFRSGPWGGGNQFLKALKKEFEREGVYEKNLEKAEAVLLNSYPFGSEDFFDKIFRLKLKHHKKIIIHRLNGPISLVRGKDKEVDDVIKLFVKLFVDGIIFQSNWCKKQNKQLFNISAPYETVIYNAPDDEIFNRNGKKMFNPNGKIKLIATSWSSNWKKGFGIYRFLDENLDFSKYEMTFVGNSPIQFRNIKWIKPVPPEMLAIILKEHDIYITASQNDPCSNSLIEALSCGLPAVALNDGGHPEVIRGGGELFNGENDVIQKIEKVSQNYHHYQSRIPNFSIREISCRYYEFAKKIYEDVQNEKYEPKRINFLTMARFYKMKLMIFKWKTKNWIGTIWKK